MNAVVYDKWLHSLGGGEMVACSVARTLKKLGYKVTIISGREISKDTIYKKLNIDLAGIDIIQIWNDEMTLKKAVKGKELFFNISFMDYSIGFAKHNIYFAHFPTKTYDDFLGLLITKVFVPLTIKFIKPIESLSQIEAPTIMKGAPAYLLGKENRYALSNLEIGKSQKIFFKLFTENFDKSMLEGLEINLENAKILDNKIEVDHYNNILKCTYFFTPTSKTCYLNIILNNEWSEESNIDQGRVYLLYPKIYLNRLPNLLFMDLFRRITTRMRAGFFINPLERLGTYQQILAYSFFAQKWIKRMWRRSSTIVSPPVDLLFKKYKLSNHKKNNWICSTGRFFTLGHGKKQEILIEAFKKICDTTGKKWELHLVGGLGDEPSSIDFFKYLRDKSQGYPIYFHLNVERQELEEVYLKSKIYWHATGFGEDENIHPIRFEHFGISPIEGMSAKCIPIVFNGGGLRELIFATGLDQERNLFDSIEDLVKKTIYFMDNKNTNINWDKIFEIIDKQYSLEAFEKNLSNYILNVTND